MSKLTSIKVSDEALQLIRKVKGHYMTKTGKKYNTNDVLIELLQEKLKEIKKEVK